jgi:hypothetical protein
MADHLSPASVSMMPRNSFVIAGLLALLLLVAWSLWNLEWIEQQSDPFFSDAANQNPYLAAQLFLERLHYVVSEDENEDALERLPDGKAVILLISGRAHLSEQRQAELLKWISNGGHLITLANREWNEKTESIDDMLQRQFDVAAVRTADNTLELVNLLFDSSSNAGDNNDGDQSTEKTDANGKDPASNATQTTEPETTEPETTESETTQPETAESKTTAPANSDTNRNGKQVEAGDANDNASDDAVAEERPDAAEQCPVETPAGATPIEWFDGQQLIAEIGGKMRIEIGDVEPSISAADAQGLQFVQFGYGAGKVTFLSSMALWSNHQISSFDNAHLLALLAGDASRVIILHDFDAVPLTDLLKHFFPATLIMLVVLITMIIFHFQQRWRSTINTQAPPRRSLHEHIAAGGRLLWRHRQIAPLIQRQQQLVTEQLLRTQQNGPLTASEIQKLLTTQTGIALEQIRIAMREPASTADELFDQIRLLQSIRNSL